MRGRYVLGRTELALLFATFLLGGGGCERGHFHDEKSIIVSGTILDKADQAPIDSAWVALGDSILDSVVFTDSDGRFAVPSFPFLGPLPLYAGRVGYKTATQPVENGSDDIKGIVMQLERTE